MAFSHFFKALRATRFKKKKSETHLEFELQVNQTSGRRGAQVVPDAPVLDNTISNTISHDFGYNATVVSPGNLLQDGEVVNNFTNHQEVENKPASGFQGGGANAFPLAEYANNPVGGTEQGEENHIFPLEHGINPAGDSEEGQENNAGLPEHDNNPADGVEQVQEINAPLPEHGNDEVAVHAVEQVETYYIAVHPPYINNFAGGNLLQDHRIVNPGVVYADEWGQVYRQWRRDQGFIVSEAIEDLKFRDDTYLPVQFTRFLQQSDPTTIGEPEAYEGALNRWEEYCEVMFNRVLLRCAEDDLFKQCLRAYLPVPRKVKLAKQEARRLDEGPPQPPHPLKAQLDCQQFRHGFVQGRIFVIWSYQQHYSVYLNRDMSILFLMCQKHIFDLMNKYPGCVLPAKVARNLGAAPECQFLWSFYKLAAKEIGMPEPVVAVQFINEYQADPRLKDYLGPGHRIEKDLADDTLYMELKRRKLSAVQDLGGLLGYGVGPNGNPRWHPRSHTRFGMLVKTMTHHRYIEGNEVREGIEVPLTAWPFVYERFVQEAHVPQFGQARNRHAYVPHDGLLLKILSYH